MDYAQVVFITDDMIGPCLALIRHICSPRSSSWPHVTVRGPIRKLVNNPLPGLGDTITVDIDDVGTFNMSEPSVAPPTVFLHCTSEQLDGIAYKPEFVDSVFHITLYSNWSQEFAAELVEVLKQFRWNLRLVLNSTPAFTTIPIRGPKDKPRRIPGELTEKMNAMAYAIFGPDHDLARNFLLTDAERLDMVRLICSYLHSQTSLHRISPLGSRDKILLIEGATVNPRVNQSQEESEDYLDWGLDLPHTATKPRGQIGGAYITPPELALDIAAEVYSHIELPLEKVRFGDPVLGTGIFFAAFMKAISFEPLASAVGYEVNSPRAEATYKKWQARGLVVKCEDFLLSSCLDQVDVLLANPPYLRYQEIPAAYRIKVVERIQQLTGIEVSGQASQYVHFMLLAHKWLAQDAFAGWLVPSEFLDTAYGASLRAYLSSHVTLDRIHRFSSGDVQFENALVSSAVVIFKNALPADDHKVKFTFGGSLSNPEVSVEVELSQLQRLSKWTGIEQSDHKWEASSLRIGDVFDVRRGIATGANNFFIVDRMKAEELGIPREFLKPVLPKARFLTKNVIFEDDDGFPDTIPQLCLIDCKLPEDVVKNQHPRFWTYLSSADDKVRNATLVRSRRLWYSQESRLPPQFLCTYMSRIVAKQATLKFILNKSSAVATNVYLMMYPKKHVAEYLAQDDNREKELFDLLQKTANEEMLINGRIYGGGLHKLEPNELANVRLAGIPDWYRPANIDELELV
jgi:adenine-specific DNA-methyltransferase